MHHHQLLKRDIDIVVSQPGVSVRLLMLILIVSTTNTNAKVKASTELLRVTGVTRVTHVTGQMYAR